MESILRDIYQAANGNLEVAQHGIVYIDEIDKLSRKGENLSTTADPGHEGVQQSLLKMLEGKKVLFTTDNSRRINPESDKAEYFDTSDLLFVVGGAFEGMEKIISKRLRLSSGRSVIGIGADLVDKKTEYYNKYIEKVTTDDFRKFGMLPELLGRLPIIAPLKELTKEQLVSILTEPKNAIIKQYQTLLSHDGVELDFTDKALETIADKAIKMKTGARALRGIVEKILNPIMYDLPDRKENVVTIDVNKDGKFTTSYSVKEIKKKA